MKIATPSEKSSPSFPATPSKSWGQAHPFWKLGWRLNPPPAEKGWGGHADYEMGHLHTKVTHNIDSTDEPVVQHVPVATKYICRWLQINNKNDKK